MIVKHARLAYVCRQASPRWHCCGLASMPMLHATAHANCCSCPYVDEQAVNVFLHVQVTGVGSHSHLERSS